MFKNLLSILSCISIVGVCGAMEDNDIGVENPFPLLIQEVAPNFLQGTQYQVVCESFEKSVLEFEKKSTQAMTLPAFPEQLTELWKEKLTLLRDTYNSLKERNEKEITALHKKLVEVTDNGFFTKSKVDIYGTDNSDELNPILQDFCQHLLQAKELTEYLVILSQKKVPSSKIPEICETFDLSVNSIRRFSIPENTEQEEEAFRIEGLLSKILSAYQYMEKGKAFNTTKNVQSMENVLDKESKLGQIMLGAFNSVS